MGLPPTSSKISSDANEVTTFKFDFPNFTGTHTGTDLSLGINSVAGGGTGLGTLTLNNVILGNGTSTPNFVAPSTSGNVLTSNGTTWVSSPASSGGTVTSVALTDSTGLFTVTGSPITTSGTLNLNYSGTALPAANGGTDLTSPGTAGNALVSNGTSWISAPLSGFSAFAAYASSQITTASSAISSGTFTTFSNSPSFSITPTITGTYKVYCAIPIETDSANTVGICRIFETSALATLLQESQGWSETPNTANDVGSSVFVQSTYTLTAGVTYLINFGINLTTSPGLNVTIILQH